MDHSYITKRIYTLDMAVLSKLVEEAKRKYFEVSRPHVIVHSVTAVSFTMRFFSQYTGT
jgi:chaperone BCS1